MDHERTSWTAALAPMTSPSAPFQNPDDLRGSVFVIGMNFTTPSFELAQHRHRKAQLIFVLRGFLTCDAGGGGWIVPPMSGIWVPSDMPHTVHASGEIEGYCLFIDPEQASKLPAEGCTISVSRLLKELLSRAASLAKPLDADQPGDWLVGGMLEELASAPVERFQLPVPDDRRLRYIAEHIIQNPSDQATLPQWAARVGLGDRSLSRLLLNETGMNFGRWRRQIHILLGLRRLSEGESVQSVALALGYESSSAFVTMFRKAMGKPPGRYLAEHEAALAAPENAWRAPPIHLDS